MPIPQVKTKRETNYLKKTFLVFGQPKIGKSTLVSNLGDDKNKILFIATEPGHKELEVYKYTTLDPKTNEERDLVSWLEFKKGIAEIAAQTEFKCVAIDTVDNLFKWCATYVKAKHNIDHESDLGFGKGYNLIAEEFSKPINYLTQLGFGVFFLSHSSTKDVESGNKKTTYTDSTLPNTAKKVINPLCDYILYLYADLEGNRWIKTKGSETVNAGDRSGRLDSTIPLEASGEELKKQLRLDALKIPEIIKEIKKIEVLKEIPNRAPILTEKKTIENKEASV